MKSNCSICSILSALFLVYSISLWPVAAWPISRATIQHTPEGLFQTASVPERKAVAPGVPSSYQTNTAVIRPFKKANINAEVEGVIERVHFEEGDLVEKGQVVIEISPDLFKIIVDRAKERVEILEIAQEQAASEAELKEYLLTHNAATKQQVTRARSEAKIAQHKAAEARRDLELAQRDVSKCTLRAPFRGYLVVLYKEQYEYVRRFDQIFLLADTSTVYAVANVPENVLPQVRKGGRALFIRPSGAAIPGFVASIGKAIDPASRTKKVKVLIDNETSVLEMGMLGSLKFLFNEDGLK